MEKYQHEGLTEFTVRPYRSKRLAEYCKRMSQDRTQILYDDNVMDALKSQGFSVETTPRSIYTVSKLYDALAGYAPGKIQNPVPDDKFQAGCALARVCFSRPKDVEPLTILPLTPDTIVAITSNPTGSAGLTNLGCSKQESMVRAYERGLQTIREEKQPEPCIAYARTQFNEKTRLVWGYPYSMTVVEGLVAKPLIDEFKRGYTPMAFAMSTMALGTKLEVASYHKDYAYSLDMSQFDATISAGLIHQAFKILKTWFDLDQREPTSGVTVRRIFHIIERYFIHTTIVMPDGHIYIGKDHGVPSGSYFTQIVDSIVNIIICGAISARFNLHVSKREVFVLGDDLLFWTNRKMDLDTIARYVNDNFHVKLHGSEKSKIYGYNEAIHYLGRDWLNGLPSLDLDAIVARMVFPETYRKYSKDADKRKSEVRKLILSYAAVYRNAWRIATKAFNGERRNIACGCANIDVNTYLEGYSRDDLNPEFVSGLQRFMRRFFHDEVKSDIPLTATQFYY